MKNDNVKNITNLIKVIDDELKMLTILETCRLLHIGRSFAYDLIRMGKLRTIKIGSKRLIRPSAIRELIAELEKENG